MQYHEMHSNSMHMLYHLIKIGGRPLKLVCLKVRSGSASPRRTPGALAFSFTNSTPKVLLCHQ